MQYFNLHWFLIQQSHTVTTIAKLQCVRLLSVLWSLIELYRKYTSIAPRTCGHQIHRTGKNSSRYWAPCLIVAQHGPETGEPLTLVAWILAQAAGMAGLDIDKSATLCKRLGGRNSNDNLPGHRERWRAISQGTVRGPWYICNKGSRVGWVAAGLVAELCCNI
jgi:hypothetical protein